MTSPVLFIYYPVLYDFVVYPVDARECSIVTRLRMSSIARNETETLQ